MTKLIVGFRSFSNATKNWEFLTRCVLVSYLPHSQQWLLPWYNLYLPLSSALVSSKSTLLCSEEVSWFPSSCFPLIFRTNIRLTFLLLTHSESHAVDGCLDWGCLCFALLFPLECWHDFIIRNSRFLALHYSWLFSCHNTLYNIGSSTSAVE